MKHFSVFFVVVVLFANSGGSLAVPICARGLGEKIEIYGRAVNMPPRSTPSPATSMRPFVQDAPQHGHGILVLTTEETPPTQYQPVTLTCSMLFPSRFGFSMHENSSSNSLQSLTFCFFNLSWSLNMFPMKQTSAFFVVVGLFANLGGSFALLSQAPGLDETGRSSHSKF